VSLYFEERAKRLARDGCVLYVDASGGNLLQILGVEDWESLVSALFALIERPRMVEDLLERTTVVYCICLERVLSRVSADYAAFYEPIASHTEPVISPAMAIGQGARSPSPIQAVPPVSWADCS
jgi:hypothetical protein